MSAQPDRTFKQRLLDWRTWVYSVVVLAPLCFFAAMIWQRRWMSDDGFINVRAVRNFLAGHGPVFNVGERIETYTSTLWFALLSFLGAIGFRVEYAAVAAGIALSLIGVFCAMWGAATLHRWKPRAGLGAFVGALPLGAVTYVAIPVAWDYGTSGLETGMSLSWLGLSYLLLARLCAGESADEPPDRPAWHWYGVAFVLGLGPLIRPELALFSLGFLAPLLVVYFSPKRGGFSFKRLVLLGVAMGALPVGYQLFRMGYFAAIVPNTAIAKEAFESRWTQGGHFFDNFFGLYELLIPLAVLAVVYAGELGRAIKTRAFVRLMLLAVPVICGLGYGLYVVKIGGGFMHGRLFLPPLFGVLLPVAAIPLRIPERTGIHRWERAVAALVVVGWAVYCAAEIRVDRENVHGIGDERGWYVRQSKVAHPIVVEDFERMYFHTDASRLRNIGERHCKSAFTDELGPWQEGENCKPIVYAKRDHRTKFGRFFPRSVETPVAREYIDRGIAMVVMRTGMGIRSLVLGPRVHVVDHVGLASPLASRLELSHRGRPGHEKALTNTWMLGRFGAPQPQEDPRISAARRALGCGDLAQLLDAVEGPITVGKFFSNIADAFRFHRLRIPQDAFDGEEKFCGVEPPHEEIYGGSGGDRVEWRCPEGHALGGFSARQHPKGEAFASVEPHCMPVAAKNGRIALEKTPAPAPSFGGRSKRKIERTDCPGGTAVIGFDGGYKRFVERLEPVCAPLELRGKQVVLGETRRARQIGDGGDDFELRCPEGQLAIGAVARAGTVTDALGLLCQDAAEVRLRADK